VPGPTNVLRGEPNQFHRFQFEFWGFVIGGFVIGRKDIQLSSVLSILGMLGMIDQRNLIFPEPREMYDPSREWVIFWGQEGDKKIRCAITREALVDYFKGSDKTLLKVFALNRTAIEQEARRKYLADRLETDGGILIKSEDL